MLRKICILAILLFTSGCAQNILIYVDGMPISNHEYNITNPETAVQVKFQLVRYYREYQGDEYLVMPEYLDALHYANQIDPCETTDLRLHIMVINPKRVHYRITWELHGPRAQGAVGLLYSGRLTRKDFFIRLPLESHGEFLDYRLNVFNEDGEDLFDLPNMRYKTRERRCRK